MIHLFVNVYADPDPARNAELLEAAARNARHPLIGAARCHAVTVAQGQRPSFADLFAATRGLPVGPAELCVVANSDICFDDTLGLAERHLRRPGDCWALTRWDWQPDGSLRFMDRIDSQDAWLFRGPVRATVKAEFHMGRPGCDNRLAWELNQAGYRVWNPGKSVRAIHLHNSGVRRYERIREQIIPPPYLRLPPVGLPVMEAALR